jgi:4-amino-4-deoxy-L-arabinose transferase-like glycosyltransferase
MDRERHQGRTDLAKARPNLLRGWWGALRGHPAFSSWVAISAMVLVGTVIRRYQLFHSLNEQYAFRQTQTAFTIREFAENGINLAGSPLPVLGAPWNVPMEFPLFQALASFLVNTGLSSDTAGRLMSLVFFQLTAVVTAILVMRWTNRLTAVLAIALFEFMPFGIEWGAASLMEFMATFLAIGMVLCLDYWLRTRNPIWLVLIGIAAPLAFAVKVTTAVPWCIVALGIGIAYLRKRGWGASWKPLLVGYAIGPGFGLVLGVLWTRYSDMVKMQNPYTEFLTSSNLTTWNFGTLEQRLDPVLMNIILVRTSESITGLYAITVILGIVAVALAKKHRIELISLAAVPFFAILVFTNLFIQHEYYLSSVYPALVAMVAFGIVAVATRLATIGRANRAGLKRLLLATVTVALLIALTWTTPFGRQYANRFLYSAAPPELSVLLSEETDPGSQILMVSCTWDPTVLYYADREGLSMQGFMSPTVPTPSDYDFSFYDYVYVCNDDAVLSNYLPSSLKLEEIDDSLYEIVK